MEYYELEAKKLELETELDRYQTNHPLNLILCLFTAGLWGLIYAMVIVSNNEMCERIETKIRNINIELSTLTTP